MLYFHDLSAVELRARDASQSRFCNQPIKKRAQASAEQIANSTQHPGPLFSGFSCNYRIEPGRRYVIYAQRTADGRWSTGKLYGHETNRGGGGRSRLLRRSWKTAPTGRVYGSIDRMILDPNDRTKIRTVPAAGVPVTLTSGVKEISITTDGEATTRTAAGVRQGETAVTVTPQMPGVRLTIRN